MKAILKKPRRNAQVVDVENTLDGIRSAIGGYFEALVFSEEHNIIMICDESGKLKGLDFNFYLYGRNDRIIDEIVGNVLFVSAKGEDLRDLDENQIDYLMKYFNFPADVICPTH